MKHFPSKGKPQLTKPRSQAIYKLINLNTKLKIIERSKVILDVGSFPGGWSQVIVGIKAHQKEEFIVISVDKKQMGNVKGVIFIRGDFLEKETQDKVRQNLHHNKIDLILSDLCPNVTGVKTYDLQKQVHIIAEIAKFSSSYIHRNGLMVCKSFSGAYRKIKETIQTFYTETRIEKPSSSKTSSSEIFFVNSSLRLGD
jgi:23S rRNA (uridine2552-2'-O)-methyltransferase